MGVAWEVEFSDEFVEWWDRLTAAKQESVDFTVSLLQELGPTLKMPDSSGVGMSRHAHMRELCIQHEGQPYRVLYAFDPRGGRKAGWIQLAGNYGDLVRVEQRRDVPGIPLGHHFIVFEVV
jgi:hypothetical protein